MDETNGIEAAPEASAPAPAPASPTTANVDDAKRKPTNKKKRNTNTRARVLITTETKKCCPHPPLFTMVFPPPLGSWSPRSDLRL